MNKLPAEQPGQHHAEDGKANDGFGDHGWAGAGKLIGPV
jgi:hypothetical protein